MQEKRLRESSDFSMRGRKEYKSSISRDLQSESGSFYRRMNSTSVKTLDRNSLLNISLSNVKTTTNSEIHRFSGFMSTTAKKRFSSDLSHYEQGS